MTFSLLIIGIILSVIAMLATLIIGIVHIATGKNRSALILGVSFIMSLIIFILCIMETVKRGSSKVQQGIEWIKKNEHKSSNYNYDWEDEEAKRERKQDIADSTARADSTTHNK